MRNMIKKIAKLFIAVAVATIVIIAPANNVKADALTDAVTAQQAALYQQQLEQAKVYQAALLAQYQQAYQQAVADQYAKSLLVFTEAQANQQRALQQAYMLNAIQQQQQAQYTAMVQYTGLDYQQHLLDVYTKYQQQAVAAFKGYEGLK